MFTVQETDDLSGLQQMFITNGVEVSRKTPDSTLTKCWEITDGHTANRIAGLHLEKRGDEFAIVGISVDKNHRKRGLGKVLVDKAIEEVRALGGKRILLVAKVPEFFTKLGFKSTDAPEARNIIYCGDCAQLNESCFPIAMYLNI